MNVMSFAQEFSSLVIRYTKEPVLNPPLDNKQPTDAPLTKQEVMNVVSNVLATLLGMNYINVHDTSLTTPTTGSAVTIPTVVNNINWSENNENACRFRSQSIQETPKNSGTFNHDLKTDKTEEKTTLEVFQDGKKFISRSSPAICVSNVGRSDTFVLNENQFAEAATNLKIFNDSFANVEMTNGVLQSLNEARMSAMSVLTKLDEIKKQAFPQTLNTRRLSTNDINPGRVSNITRSTIPAKVRRSISDFPVTPTSSRSTGSQNSVEKRKNLNPVSTDIASRKLGSTAVTRSISNLHLSSNNKSFDSNRPTKNPKYAHVQSTIPKPILNKRKA